MQKRMDTSVRFLFWSASLNHGAWGCLGPCNARKTCNAEVCSNKRVHGRTPSAEIEPGASSGQLTVYVLRATRFAIHYMLRENRVQPHSARAAAGLNFKFLQRVRSTRFA